MSRRETETERERERERHTHTHTENIPSALSKNFLNVHSPGTE